MFSPKFPKQMRDEEECTGGKTGKAVIFLEVAAFTLSSYGIIGGKDADAQKTLCAYGPLINLAMLPLHFSNL